MSARHDATRLADALIAARDCLAIERRYGTDAIESDEVVTWAVTNRVMVIGEALYQVTKATRQLAPEIAWANITGMRHIIVHEYDRVHVSELVRVVEDDLETLISQLEKLIRDLTGETV